MRRQTVERLKAAASAKSYVRVTASGDHVSLASVGVEVCFQGTWAWLMAAIRGRGSWRLMKGRRKCAEKGCEANSVKGPCSQRNKREVCFVFFSLFVSRNILPLVNLSAARFSCPQGIFGHLAIKQQGSSVCQDSIFKERNQNKKTMMSLL